VSLASLLRDAAARLRIWCGRSSVVATAAATSDATATTMVGRIRAEGPPKRRRPMLWEVRSSKKEAHETLIIRPCGFGLVR